MVGCETPGREPSGVGNDEEEREVDGRERLEEEDEGGEDENAKGSSEALPTTYLKRGLPAAVRAELSGSSNSRRGVDSSIHSLPEGFSETKVRIHERPIGQQGTAWRMQICGGLR